MKKIFLIALLNISFTKLNSEKFQLNQIHKWADVLNIEGGTIPKKLNKNQKWFNVATVLDKPYIDGIEFDFMSKNKKFDLKESAINDYNELQNYFVHITLLKYCIDNAHILSNKKNNENVKIVVQVHRPKSGIKYINLLNEIICKAYPEFNSYKKLPGKLPLEVFIYELPNNININFRYGSAPQTLNDYEDVDIVISISLVAGFNPNLKSGDMVIPTKFVPMDLDTMILKFNEKYFVKNYFLEDLEKIVNSQDINLLTIINEYFKSPNKTKNLKATKFNMDDFKEVTDLHVNKDFSPSLLPKEFLIVN